MHETDNVWLHGTDVPLSWARNGTLTLDLLNCVLILTVDILGELLVFFHVRAVLGSRLSPNVL